MVDTKPDTLEGMTKASIAVDARDKIIPLAPLKVTVLAEVKSCADSVTMEPIGLNCGAIENVAPLPLAPNMVSVMSNCKVQAVSPRRPAKSKFK